MKHLGKKQIMAVCLLLLAAVLTGCGGKQEQVEVSAASSQETTPYQTVVEFEDIVIEVEQEDLSDLVTGVMYALDSVNIRKGAGTDSEIAGKLAAGDEVSILGMEGEDWVKVLFGDEVCYVAAKYLTEDKDWQAHLVAKNGLKNGDEVKLDPSWKYADFAEIKDGAAVMYLAPSNRKNIVIGLNAGHGTKGGSNVKTWCHPDKTEKVTGGTTAAGATKAMAVSGGMTFSDGAAESKVNLRVAQLVRDMLLEEGYDVLMIRDGDDVQLDNVARTVICNNMADCHIAIHFDGDGLNYDKGCFYMSVPEGIKYLDNVAAVWEKSEKLGDCLVEGLKSKDNKINGNGKMDMDLTQTSYSFVPSIDIELGNQASDHSEEHLKQLAAGIVAGIRLYYEQ